MLSADGGFTGSFAFTTVDFVAPGRIVAWPLAATVLFCAVEVFVLDFNVDGVLAFPAGFLSVLSAADEGFDAAAAVPGFAFLAAAAFFTAESEAGAGASHASICVQGSNSKAEATTTTRDVDLLLNSFAPATRIKVEPYDRKSLLQLPLLAFKAYLYDSKLRQPLAGVSGSRWNHPRYIPLRSTRIYRHSFESRIDIDIRLTIAAMRWAIYTGRVPLIPEVPLDPSH